ncbi:hypothetical protein GCM10010492_53170 [Saccharothrix mutabilis subsp. mutabilis]|uniref:N-acetyltransferase domain-containing protein n=1 Tax=Saccharothrix mutabilis subsp. mutabilis TaxID=66855 RepID=A0ABN0UDP6_9PSEU
MIADFADRDIAPVAAALCAEDTGRPCPWDAGCRERHPVLLGPVLAAADVGNAAVARVGGRLAGYARVVVSAHRGSLFVECAGGVVPGWRGRGVGRALLEWSRDRSLALAGGRHVELLVDVLDGQDDLRGLAQRLGFGYKSGFAELSRPLLPAIPGPPGPDPRPLDPDGDRDAVTDLYTTVFEAEPTSGRGRARIAAALEHPGLRPELSRVLVGPAGLLGFLLVVTWPDDPTDLWVETVCVRPAERGTGAVRRMLADVTRCAPRAFTTLSIGVPRGTDGTWALAGYADLGFVRVGGWDRYSLLLA